MVFCEMSSLVSEKTNSMKISIVLGYSISIKRSRPFAHFCPRSPLLFVWQVIVR